MAMTQCKNGHFYDTDQHASCPYCGRQQPIIDFNETQGPAGWNGGASGGGTQAPSGWGGASGGTGGGHTQPPTGWGGTSGGTGDGKTQAPSGWGGTNGGTGDGKTQPPSDWARREKKDDGKTRPIMDQDVFDPDVGWLVCIAGPDRGRSFALKAKGNTIGRSSAKHRFDISLDKDLNISREAIVASISYDAKRNSFVFICGETSILYVNGEVAGSRMALHPFDAIEIGNSETTLLFVPLCGARFNWADGLKGGASD